MSIESEAMTEKMKELDATLQTIGFKLRHCGCGHFQISGNKKILPIAIWHDQGEISTGNKNATMYFDLKTCVIRKIDEDCVSISMNEQDETKYPFILINNRS